MPVHSKNKHRVKLVKKNKSSFKFPFWLKYILYIPFALVVVFILYIAFAPSKYWDGKSRLALAVNTKQTNINVLVFDPQTNSITSVIVPENAELEVARQLGAWKTGSIWKLGVNEKVGGQLLSETITKSFRLPTEAWADTEALGFSKANSISILKAMFTGYKTNLTLKDKIGIGLFSLSVKNSERSEIDLSQTPFLTKAKLSDGSSGYKVREVGSAQISAIFADSKISEENFSVNIFYPEGKILTAQKLGEIVQVLGTKVTSLQPLDVTNFDCIILGRESITRTKIAQVFSCKVEKKDLGSTLEIKIGDNFIKRF
ncbi:hypothetical protein KW795_01620 [Candidatus Microgenomates bacterium]|nr:hypothetical protein [Candidatus Microgenomates bacterium]